MSSILGVMQPMSATERKLSHDLLELKEELTGVVQALQREIATLQVEQTRLKTDVDNLRNGHNALATEHTSLSQRFQGFQATPPPTTSTAPPPSDMALVASRVAGDWRGELEELQLQVNVWKADVVSQLATLTSELSANGKSGNSDVGLSHRVKTVEDNQVQFQRQLTQQEQRFTKTLQSMEGYFGNAISHVSMLRDTLVARSNKASANQPPKLQDGRANSQSPPPTARPPMYGNAPPNNPQQAKMTNPNMMWWDANNPPGGTTNV